MIKLSYTFFLTLLLTSCITPVFSQLEEMAFTEETEDMFKHVSRSSNDFCSSFYSNVAAKLTDNIACSPLSAHVILSLVAYGAREKTAQELKTGLHLPADDSLALQGFKSLIDSLKNVKEVELNLANTIYIQANVSLAEDFLTINSEFFRSDTPRVDFRDNVASAKEINSWVEKETNNKITGIISADDIDETTKIVLVNAIYFKGTWAQQFNTKLTENRPFYITKDVKTHVPTMSKKFKYPHGHVEELNARIIELPYSNKDFSMLILLPNEIGGLQFLEANFNKESIENVEWNSEEIHLFLPKFKVESTINLEDTLREMGMKTMFSDLANFSGMTKEELKVDKIIQKAFIEVNEEGCEAAAATAVKMRMKRCALPGVESFQVDRPFMFAIQHKPSNILMFVGSIRSLQIFQGRDEL